MCVALASMILSLGGVGYSATGGNFILGRANVAGTQTSLAASPALNGRVMQVTNSSTGGNATALGLNVAAGRPPMAVNSAVKVVNLNVDKLDGLDSLHFARSMTIPFNLAAGGTMTAPIALPINRNVLVMTTSNTNTQEGRGSAFATITRLSTNELSWAGVNSCCVVHTTPAAGKSSVVGDNILVLDSGTGGLVLEVAGPGSIRIANYWDNASQTRTGTLTLLW
jgi:hypothetical protein